MASAVEKAKQTATEQGVVATLPLSKQAQAIGPHMTTLDIGGQTFKVTKRVTIPTLSHDLAKGVVAVAVEFVSEFVESKSKMANAAPDAMVNAARIIDLTTGEVMNYVGGTVVVSEIKQAYPNGSYVGKKMIIKKVAGPSGKRYNRAEIYEIE